MSHCRDSKQNRIRRSRILPILALALVPPGCEGDLEIQVVRVDVGPVESTATSIEPGLVQSRNDSTLSPPISGRIVEVYCEEGDRVKKGDSIIRLENDLERVALAEAKLELERLMRLDPVGAASRELVDRAQFRLERATINLERTLVQAPFDGILVELNADLGQMSYGSMPLDLVMGGQSGGNSEKAMARVVDNTRLYVEADIDEADYSQLAIDQLARVTVEALNDEVLPGRLVRVAQSISTAEGRNRSLRVEIEIDENCDEAPGAKMSASRLGLLVGMSADIEIVFRRVEGAVRVPTLVILEGEGEKLVYVVEDGKLRRRLVKVGVSNWELTEIKEGLADGDLVVVPTNRKDLEDGRVVKVKLRDKK